MERATGAKVKDDAGLLRKSLKTKEKKKAQSTQQWQKRLSEQEQRKAEERARNQRKKEWRLENKNKGKKGNNRRSDYGGISSMTGSESSASSWSVVKGSGTSLDLDASLSSRGGASPVFPFLSRSADHHPLEKGTAKTSKGP